MKCKSLVLMLVLTLAAWAQTAAPGGTQPNAAPEAKAKCSCCDKMASADAKESKACMRHMGKNADGKDMGSCCAGKDGKYCCEDKAKSCVRADKGKGCCGSADKDRAAACCKHSEQASSGVMNSSKRCCSGKSEKASHSCCRGMMQS